jgi:hypothetical protein
MPEMDISVKTTILISFFLQVGDVNIITNQESGEYPNSNLFQGACLDLL